MAATSSWTAYVDASTVSDPGATTVTSFWTSWETQTTSLQPVNEWYVAGASAWTAADLVSLS